MARVKGVVWYGDERTIWDYWKEPEGPETIRLGLAYRAEMRDDHLFLWRDGQWIESPGYAKFFIPDEP